MADIVFKEIEIKNFMSFGNEPQTYKFRKTGLTLVLGKNKDNKTMYDSSNGGGKSTFCVNAILFCLYGATDKKVKANTVVNKFIKKNCYVKIQCSVNSDEHYIERYRTDDDNGNNLRVFINGHDRTHEVTRSSTDLTQEFIDGVFGDLKTFLNSIVFSQELIVNFLKLRPSERKEIVEKILQLERLNEFQTKFKEKYKTKQEELTAVDKVLAGWDIQIRTKKEAIEKYKQQTEETKKRALEEIKRIESEIKNISKIDIESLKKLQTDYETIKNEYNLFKPNFFNKQKMLTDYIALIKKNISDRPTVVSKKKHISAVKANPSKCPVCDNQIHQDKFEKHLKELEDDMSGKIDEMKERIEERKKLKPLIKQLIGNYTKPKYVFLTNALASLQAEKNKYKEYFDKLDMLSQESEKLLKEKSDKEKSISTVYNEDYVKKIDEEIREISRDIPEKEKEKSEIKKELNHLQWLIESLDLKNERGLKNYLILSNLPIINQRLEYYSISAFPNSTTIKFNSKFEEEIKMDNEPIDFANLSGGEKKRLDLTINLTLFDLNRLNFNRTNILIMDEVLDALDSDGTMTFLSIFKSISETHALYLISHSDWVKSSQTPQEAKENLKNIGFEEIIVVEKENKFSKITVY